MVADAVDRLLIFLNSVNYCLIDILFAKFSGRLIEANTMLLSSRIRGSNQSCLAHINQ
jgi:hypothetical protein